MPKSLPSLVVVFSLLIAVLIGVSHADNVNFHDAPESAKQLKNPYEGKPKGVKAGQPLYHLRCARCHRGEWRRIGQYSSSRFGIKRSAT